MTIVHDGSRTIGTLIPEDTPRATLVHLRRRYLCLAGIPAWYRTAILAQLDALLAPQQEAA
jgi:hypothetical protein